MKSFEGEVTLSHSLKTLCIELLNLQYHGGHQMEAIGLKLSNKTSLRPFKHIRV